MTRIYLKKGWNLISLPLDAAESNSLLVKQYIDSHLENTEILEAVSRTSARTALGQLGYYIRVSEDVELFIDEENSLTQTIVLNEGWNLIGFSVNLNDLLLDDAYLNDLIQIKNQTQSYIYGLPDSLNTLQSLNTTDGYWINVSQTCTLRINLTAFEPEQESPQDVFYFNNEEAYKEYFTDVNGNGMILNMDAHHDPELTQQVNDDGERYYFCLIGGGGDRFQLGDNGSILVYTRPFKNLKDTVINVTIAGAGGPHWATGKMVGNGIYLHRCEDDTSFAPQTNPSGAVRQLWLEAKAAYYYFDWDAHVAAVAEAAQTNSDVDLDVLIDAGVAWATPPINATIVALKQQNDWDKYSSCQAGKTAAGLCKWPVETLTITVPDNGLYRLSLQSDPSEWCAFFSISPSEIVTESAASEPEPEGGAQQEYGITITAGAARVASPWPSWAKHLTVTIGPSHVLIHGEATGSATAAASGGAPPYTYLWDDGQTTPTTTGLVAGTYSVTVSDRNGASITNLIVITQPAS